MSKQIVYINNDIENNTEQYSQFVLTLFAVGNMPIIVAVSAWHKAQGHIIPGTLHRSLGLAVSAPQKPSCAVS